jgi:hypothetical protein
MRRVARHLLTLCSLASLVLCVALSALWVRSYFVADLVGTGWVAEPPTEGTYVRAYCNWGAIELRRFDLAVVGTAPPEYHVRDGLRIHTGQDRRWWTGVPESSRLSGLSHLFNFNHHDATYLRRPERDVQQSERDRGVTFPHWVAVLATALLPALAGRRARLARRRRRLGLCMRCGYDLRATRGQCPECGTVPAADDISPEPAADDPTRHAVAQRSGAAG